MHKQNIPIEFGRSIRGLNWVLDNSTSYDVENLCQKLGIDALLAKIMVNRSIKTVEAAQSFLNPKIKDLLPNPFTLKDCRKAAERIADAIINEEKVAIFGDYDVDGATSSALFGRFFRMLNKEAIVYIPNRMKEGYGPTVYAFEQLKEQGVSLVITVDCGIVSFEPLEAAAEMGLDVIVVDHHLGAEKLPRAVAVVNPNRMDEDFTDKHMAAVGVSFMVAVGVRSVLRERDWFESNQIAEPDLMLLLDLVALGTVCDVMPLTGINRAFVSQGIKLMATRQNLGIATLSDMARLDTAPQSYHLGFVFGPRINAGGRVGEGMLGWKLLYTNSEEEAHHIAKQLEKLNEMRKVAESNALRKAIAQVEAQNLHLNPIVFAVGAEWHVGILGILAGRLKERYGRPAAAISIVDTVGKGSARSIQEIDFGSAIASAKDLGLILDGGGHAMAGGFSIEKDKIDHFYEFLVDRFKNVEDSILNAKKIYIDAVINIRALNANLLRIIELAAPFGCGNSQPRIAVMDVYVVKVALVKPNHLMVIVSDSPGSSHGVKCMLFKGENTPLGDFLSRSIGKKIDIVGAVQSTIGNGKRIDFILEDVAVHE